MFEALLLDMDGLMFDTETYSDIAWQEAAQKLNMQIGEYEFALMRGKNEHEIKKLMTQHYKNESLANEMLELSNEIWLQKLSINVPHKEGLLNLLQFAKSKNIKMAVASSTKRQIVISNLKKAGVYEYISAIAAGDEVENSKPAPDIFLLAAQRLFVNAQNCLVLEDSPNGVRAAKSAECTVIMVPDKEAPTNEIKQLCYKVVNTLNDVVTQLKTD